MHSVDLEQRSRSAGGVILAFIWNHIMTLSIIRNHIVAPNGVLVEDDMYDAKHRPKPYRPESVYECPC
jgi:hypothetical protein